MPVTIRVTDNGLVEEASAASKFSVEVPFASTGPAAFLNSATASAFTATVPGFYYVTGAAASGSLFTVPNPASFPGAQLSISEIGTNQVLLSGAYAGKTFVTTGSTRGAVCVLPTSGFISFISSGVSWCMTAVSGAIGIYS